jgi:type IV pilus assembly protein PilA
MLKKSNQKGFTIIEVLIVLAIAGLIMVVVFLAVPALQRNSRNQSYRSEANRIASAYNEVVTNKGGTAAAASVANATAASPPTDADKIFAASNPKTFVTIRVETRASATPTAATQTQAVVVTGAKCGGGAADATTTDTGTGRQAALFFAVEDRGGNAVVQCLDI